VLSGFTWPLSGWVEVPPPLEPSRRGVHACRVEDLPHWLDEELWRVELAGAALSADRMVVAERGRLLDRVDAWSAGVLRELAAVSLARRCHDASLLADAAYWDEPISTAYMSAHSAGLEADRSGGGYWAGFTAERAAQADWLAARLGLER
jgi:hypothetical protein